MIKLGMDARSYTATIAVFVLSFVFLLLFMDLRVIVCDEGLIFANAVHVWSGAVPHRDFYTNYGPAQIYILGAILKVTGPSFLVGRIYDLVLRAAIVAICFRFLAVRTHGAVALAGTAFCGLWLFGLEAYLYPVVPSILLSLLSSLLLIGAPERGDRSAHYLGAGALTGLTALFRYDVGFFIVVAHVLALGLLAASQEGSAQERIRRLVRQVLLYGIGTAAVFVPVAAILLIAGAGPGFMYDIFHYAAGYYVKTRGFPFPRPGIVEWPFSAAVYVPFVLVPAAVAALIWSRSRKAQRPLSTSEYRFVLVLTVLAAILVAKGLTRILPLHMMLAIIPSTIVLVFLLARWKSWPWLLRIALLPALGLGLFTASLQGARIVYQMAKDPSNALVGTWLGFDGEGTDVSRRIPNLGPARVPVSTACTSEFLLGQVRPGERILSGTGRHDKLFMNNFMIYFATGTRTATHWQQYEPGMQTSPEVQREMISELKTQNVRFVVRDATWDDYREPNDSAISSGVRLLDEYIEQAYRPVARYDTVSVWMVKGQEPVPAAPSPTCATLQARTLASR